MHGEHWKRSVTRLFKKVYDQTGVALDNYKSSVVDRALGDRLNHHGVTLEEYLHLCDGKEHEYASLLDGLYVNTTCFYRDPMVFDLIGEHFIPYYREKQDIRAWCVGCSTGEEPYSLAIELVEHMEQAKGASEPIIFATDVDAGALQIAHRAHYSGETLQNLRLRHISRWFSAEDEGFTLRDELRSKVHFSRGDVLDPAGLTPPESIFGSFDLILCRNTLIYFAPKAQQRVLLTLISHLSPAGYLVLGENEKWPEDSLPTMKRCHPSRQIFRKTSPEKPGTL